MPKKKFVNWEKEEGIGIITVNNPPVNALGEQVMEEIIECFEEIEEDVEARVAIITGAGEKAFIAGADIKEFPNLLKGTPGAAKDFAAKGHDTYNKIYNCSKPTIAVVNGLCLGGGCEVAIACDLRVSSNSAKFGLPEINLGLFPGGGGTQRLPRLIGISKAKKLMYLGSHISAEEACNLGIVDQVFEKEEIMNDAKDLAKEIAKKPGVALQLIKQCVNRGTETSLEEGLRIETDLFDRAFQTEDVQEGVNAFLEKREPNFKHR